MTYEELTEIYSDIINLWGEDGKAVCLAIHNTPKYIHHLTWNEFLDCCITCGGNWVGTILSGIKKIAPTVYDALPDHLGNPTRAFSTLCNIAYLLGVDFPS